MNKLRLVIPKGRIFKNVVNISNEAGINLLFGMIIYSGKISLTTAFIESLDWQYELIPTITQDYKV